MTMKKSKVLSILLSLALMLGLMPGMSLTAFAEGTEPPAYSGGTGTEADPYLISTVDDWKALADAVNDGEAYADKYFRQTADLDMSEAGNLDPVGTLEHPFAGNYEGDGFAISNAAITGMPCSVQGYNMNVAGLFGALVGGGSISNLRVTNVSATATSGSGGWDQAYAGGLVAYAEDCTITDCSVSGSTIIAGNSNIFAGALAGFASAAGSEKTMFSKCASENNTVNTYDYGGGFIGAIVNEANSDEAISFTNCYSAHNTADAGSYIYGTVGGFLGGSQGGNVTVKNCFVYDCNATATGTSSGKGVFTGDTDYGTVKATNTYYYYYDTNDLPVNAESATSKTADEMKSLAATLGEAFTQGDHYPILLHPVNLAVSIEGWTYGETASTPSVAGNSGNGTVTYQYKVKDADDSTYSETVPTNAGDYTVKATVAATSTHKAAEATADFTISGSSGGGSNADVVQAVINKINALDPSASDYAAKAQEAVDAYNALTDSQKNDDRFKDQTVAAKLADAQQAVADAAAAAADRKAADEASALINKLPDDPKKASEADAQTAYAAYMKLTDTQKALLDNAATQKVAAYKYFYEAKSANAKKAKLISVKAKKGRKAVAKWKKVAGVSGYQLYYKAKGTKAKKANINNVKTLKKTVRKLKTGKKYTFKVRTFTKIYDPAKGKMVKKYGKWSNVKKAKAKK